MTVEQDSGNAEAQGNVAVSLASADRDATHVFADHARLLHVEQRAEFSGTDAHPARLWQAGSRVTAASLFLDDAHKSLLAKPASAGGSVLAEFAPETRAAGTKTSSGAQHGRAESGSGAGEAVHVSSAALSYSGLRHEAVCSGGVRVRQGEMQIRAQQAVMFLDSAPPNGKGDGAKTAGTKTEAGKTDGAKTEASGSAAGTFAQSGQLGGTLQRVVFSGSVRMDEPGRAGDGEQLVFTAKDGDYLLTGAPGKPPRIADVQQGVVTGPACCFVAAKNRSS